MNCDKNKVERILEGLRLRGVSGRGTYSRIAEKTGYTLSMVGKVLSGKTEMGERFVKVLCSAFGINEDWVFEGKGAIVKEDQSVILFPTYSWPRQQLTNSQGDRLREIRESLGYSLEEMAVQLNIDVDSLQQCENAISIKDNYLLNKMALFCINVNWLMTGRGKMRLEEWPIVISKENTKIDWSGRSPTITYEIDDLFTTRLKKTLNRRSAGWLSDETHIGSQRIGKILSGETIPTVDELESIAYALGRINPRWLAQKSDFPKEDWEYELFRNASASDLPYKIYKLCETAVEDYILESKGLIILSSDKKMQIVGALGRLHLKESPQRTEINKEVLKVLVNRSRSAVD